jgi:enoyl-CoA hydratase/carnithine racemase
MPSPALNRVAAPEALDDEVEALVARIVAKPRVAIAPGKALFYRQLEQASCLPARMPARRSPTT